MKNKVSAQISTKGTYLGYFEAEKHTTNMNNDKPSRSYDRLAFRRADGIERRDLISMGDIVYGMYVYNTLTKIGKAGGANGWAQRAQTYSVDPAGEATNRKILKHLAEDFKTKNPKIYVYGLSIPRIKNTFFCSITQESIDIELPQNSEVETHLTAVAEEQGEDLIFCTQKV
tara:strand:+ start:49 stop:564 length:516 start_codon:yes stop_codon:yes gene_type:complete